MASYLIHSGATLDLQNNKGETALFNGNFMRKSMKLMCF